METPWGKCLFLALALEFFILVPGYGTEMAFDFTLWSFGLSMPFWLIIAIFDIPAQKQVG